MTESSSPTVAVIGGGYGGIHVASALDGVADVTLVDPKEAFVHNVAAWRALVEPQWLDRIFLPYEQLLDKGRFVRDRAVAIDGHGVELAAGELLEPDYLVLATGSSYPFPAKSADAETATARARYGDAHDALRAARSALIVGAGPAGLELAGEIRATFPDKRVTVVDAAPEIMVGPFEQELRDELSRQLAKLDVELRLGSPLRGLPDSDPATAAPVSVVTEAGERIDADVWFRAFGVAPSSDYLRGGLAEQRDAAGYLAVDEHLRVRGEQRIFALGDLADADRNMSGMATAQAEVVAANVRAAIAGEGELQRYERWPTVIAVPLGPEGGAGQLPGQDGIAGPETIAALKGRDMLIDRIAQLFGVGAAA